MRGAVLHIAEKVGMSTEHIGRLQGIQDLAQCRHRMIGLAAEATWIRFFMVSVATTARLSPSVYDSRKRWPWTWISISAAIRMLSRPVNGDSGIGVTPTSGVPYVR